MKFLTSACPEHDCKHRNKKQPAEIFLTRKRLNHHEKLGISSSTSIANQITRYL